MISFFKKTLAAFFCITVFSFSVFAEPGFNLWGSGKVFKLDPVTDGVLLGTGVLLSGGDLVLDNVMELNRAKYDSAKIYNKDNINGFDRYFMNPYDKSLDSAADITLVCAMMAPGVLVFTDKEEWVTEAVMYAETLLIANGIKEITKLCVSRPRPYMFYNEAGKPLPEEDLNDGDWANSFPSGHTTMAFAGATFATYTFAKYNPDSFWKYGVAAGSYSLAAATSVLRMKSGNHFASDVLAGALIGSATGFLVPWCHTFNQKNQLNINLALSSVSFKVEL